VGNCGGIRVGEKTISGEELAGKGLTEKHLAKETEKMAENPLNQHAKSVVALIMHTMVASKPIGCLHTKHLPLLRRSAAG
jgi:hypothetical protein